MLVYYKIIHTQQQQQEVSFQFQFDDSLNHDISSIR